MASNDEVPEETADQRLALEREFAKHALAGIMVYAAAHNVSEEEVAQRVWRIAREMVDAEFRPEPKAPPAPPQRGRR